MDRPFDPILVEVIRNQIAAITEEMTLTVYRTGRSGMCKVGDFATAVCDRHGRIIGEGGSPYQMCVFIDTMASVLAKHGQSLKPGDIIIGNDPYFGVSHMPDITLIAPAFWKDIATTFMAWHGRPINATLSPVQPTSGSGMCKPVRASAFSPVTPRRLDPYVGAPIIAVCCRPRTMAPSGYGMQRRASVCTCLRDTQPAWLPRHSATINKACSPATGTAVSVCGTCPRLSKGYGLTYL